LHSLEIEHHAELISPLVAVPVGSENKKIRNKIPRKITTAIKGLFI